MGRFREYRRFLLCGLLLAAVLLPGIGCRRQADVDRRVEPCSPCRPTPSEPAQVWLPIAGRTVILDAGHGGKDPGACHFEVEEKEVNLDLALRTARLLRARGVTVQLTRDADVFVPLKDRAAITNTHPKAVFVSIHVNASGQNPQATGVETYVLTAKFSNEDRAATIRETASVDGFDSDAGRRILGDLATRCRDGGPRLAAILQRSLTSRLAERDRGVKTANLAVLRETYFCTAVLVEAGFVSNEGTAGRMRTEEWRRATAQALADGIAEFLRQPESAL